MKNLILTLGLLIAQTQVVKAKDLSLELFQGFAYHYEASKYYNDSVFKDNHTSTNTLIRFKYDGFALTSLADSQGDMSFAATYSKTFYNKGQFSIDYTLGLYILRGEKLPEFMFITQFPTINMGKRGFILSPLAGLELEYKLNNTLSLTGLVTPAFTLFGLKLKLFK